MSVDTLIDASALKPSQNKSSDSSQMITQNYVAWDVGIEPSNFLFSEEILISAIVFSLCEDGVLYKFLIPSFSFGCVCFFDLGCFPDAIRIGKAAFFLIGYVGWVG
jgi:hypothetical protein